MGTFRSGTFDKILKNYLRKSAFFSYSKVAGCRFPTLMKTNPFTGIFKDMVKTISCISQNFRNIGTALLYLTNTS